MKLFTEQLDKNNRSFNIRDNKDMENYLNKFSKDLPKEIVNIINDLINLNINDEAQLRIVTGGGNIDLKTLARKLSVSLEDLEKLQEKIQNTKEEDLCLIPLYINDQDLESLLKGNKDLEDISLDLISDRGRAQIVRKYSNLAVSIASKYRGKSGLDWNSLVSAANMGLVKAMNDYRRPTSETAEEQKNKALSFKQYAGYRIKQQILNDINDFSRTVRRPQYQWDKAKAAGLTIPDDMSIDKGYTDADDIAMMDKIKELSDEMNVTKTKESKQLEKVCDILNNKFSDKTMSIFYSYFGINGYKKMTGVELSKRNGCSVSAISQHISKVIKFLQSDRNTRSMMRELLDIYSESLISTFFNKNLDDRLIKDSIYNLIREMFEYDDPDCWNYKVWECLDGMTHEDADVIAECLEKEDKDMLDEKYDDCEYQMRMFISKMYPMESVNDMSDVEILERMSEIQKHHIEVNE